jgi:hypothetical protein
MILEYLQLMALAQVQHQQQPRQRLLYRLVMFVARFIVLERMTACMS